jgi:Putative Ig domain
MDSRPRVAHVGLIGMIAIGLAGCGDGEDTQAAITQTTTVANRAPVIGGTPPASVLAGGSYGFLPVANDADGDDLSFSAAGLPSWASFNTVNGALTGRPTAGDIGTYGNVSITVTDGTATASLGPFSIQVVQVGPGTVTLTWMPPTENTDGSVLTDLAGYVVYWGTVSGSYPNSVTLSNPGLTSYVVDNLLSGTTYYFATTAYNNDGMESTFSNEASKAIP